MKEGLIGRKRGMTQVFGEDGSQIPVTVIEAGPLTVLAIRTKAAHGYDAVMVLVDAIQKGGENATAFWKGMRAVHELKGVTGTLQFDEKGDVAKFPHVYIVRQGKAIDVEEERQRQIEEARKKMIELENELRRLQTSGGN